MRGVFLGTPAAALPSLDALATIADIAGVFTRPDRPRGRSKKLVASPIKERAEAAGWPVFQPASRTELTAVLGELPEIDVGLVVAFGMIIEAGALAKPRRGMVNVHFSRLPRWRGAAPVERAILAGDTATGVTLMEMDEGLDTGPILAVAETPIGSAETAGELSDRLALLGSELVLRVLPSWVAGNLKPTPQTADGVTYASKLRTEEARLDPWAPAASMLAMIRAFNPRPGAFAHWKGERLKIWQAQPAVGKVARSAPGTLELVDDKVLLHTGTNPVELLQVQPAGKNTMTALDWARGRRLPLGSLE